MNIEIEKQIITLLSDIYPKSIINWFRDKDILSSNNKIINNRKAFSAIIILKEIEATSNEVGIPFNCEKFDIQWIGDNPYVNIDVYSRQIDYSTAMVNFPLYLTTLFINDIDVLFKKSNKTYISIDFIRTIPEILKKYDLIMNKNENTKSVRNKTYLMIDENTGLYKIGKSITPEFRERTLQSEKPTIRLINVSNLDIESELHIKFNSKRVRGEWFNLDDNDIKEILSMFLNQN